MERNYCDMANAIHTGKIRTVAKIDKAAVGIVPTDAQFEALFTIVILAKCSREGREVSFKRLRNLILLQAMLNVDIEV